MPDDLCGDALADLALGLGIDRQRKVGMGLDVDEARRHRQPVGVDGPGGVVREATADRRDAAVPHGEIGRNPGAAAPVVERAAADQDVAGHYRLSRTGAG